MTLNQVKKRVKAIEAVQYDTEAAHSLEDELYRSLIQAIASGNCADPAACCQEAIRAQEMNYSRWCA